jgi:hypothetical protein
MNNAASHRLITVSDSASGGRARGVSGLRFKTLILPAAMLALASFDLHAADAPTAQIGAVGDLASLLEGEFTTAAAPDDQVGTGKPGATLFYDISKRVDVPALGHDVVYSELHENGANGPIVRQSLYWLKADDASGKITMNVYSIGNAQALAGAVKNPAPLAKLAVTDLTPAAGGCTVSWQRTDSGFEGMLQPASCKGALKSDDKDADVPDMAVSKFGMTERVQAADPDKPTVFRRVR